MAKAPTLRNLSSMVPTPEHLDQIAKEIETASDRHFAILAATDTENLLQEAILLSLPQQDKETTERLTGDRGSVNSFSQKIDLGFALALYDKATQSDLHRIRAIRNAFAHTFMPIDFDTPQVASKAMVLTSGQFDNPPNTTNRDRFRYAYRFITNALLRFMIERQKATPSAS